jgi:putative CocE/NonD family hydrolase
VRQAIYVFASCAVTVLSPILSGREALATERPKAAPAFVTSPLVPGVKCQTVQVAMRDGTLLVTDVYLPAKSGAYPVIEERNPYGSAGCFLGPFEPQLARFAQHGYAGVFQDVRGTYLSGGLFSPFIQERNDEYDAVEWAAAQPWSTGKVGTTGFSYLGVDQWMGAISSPPHLYAINPDIASSDPHDNPVYENGVLRLSDLLQYASDFVPDDITRSGTAKGLPPSTIARQIAAYEAGYATRLTSLIDTVPLSAMPVYRSYRESNWYYTWLDNSNYDAYWSAQDTETHFPSIKVPALIGGASDDLFNIGAIRNYQGMRNAAGNEAARTGTKLYWEAYGHAGDSGRPTFGNDAVPWDTNPTGLQLAFFDHYLKGQSNAYESAATASIYVLVPPNRGETGSGFWLSASDFPVPGSKLDRYYLASDGHANSRLGDGSLVTSDVQTKNDAVPVGTSNDQFVYDPRDPVPTVGGNLLLPDALTHKEGFQDQSTVELRKDVLVYTSAPLTASLAVIGTVNASFWAMTSADDTDFTVKLVDVHPDGITNNIVDRIIRARFRLGSKRPPVFIQPNAPYHYGLQVGNTAYLFPSGHRLRVEISSSNFPKFARNLNTTQESQLQDRFEIAHQTILHDVHYPAYIELPVAPDVKAP